MISSMNSSNLETAGALRTFLQVKVAYRGESAVEAISWKLARRLEALLSALPDTCLAELAAANGGLVVFAHSPNRYSAEPTTFAELQQRGIAQLNGAAFLSDTSPALPIIGSLLDHYLGSRFESDRMISTHAPGVPGWDDVHHRLLAAYATGYADSGEALHSPSAYWTWAFAGYLANRRRLSQVDPLAFRLLHSTVFDEAFWRGHPRRPQPASGAIV